MLRADGSLWIADRHGQKIESYHVPQGDTHDCGPHVTAMVINFCHGNNIVNAATLAREMNRPRFGGGFPPLVVRRVPNWATFPWGIVDVLRQHDLAASWRFGANDEHLQAALREDRIVLPIYGEPLRRQGWHWNGWSHVAILIGWDPAAGEYWFVDSSRFFAPTSRSHDDFIRLWGNMRRLVIEVSS
jgi:hypothetical protein